MDHTLIASRDPFLQRHPEQRFGTGGRVWHGHKIGHTGPKLVLLPGTLGRADIFWQQMMALENKARILALTYPGGGTLEDWAADIAQIIEAEKMAGAVILGSSLGGYVAQYLAASTPDLFSGLVAANTLPSVKGIEQVPPYSLDLETTPIGTLRGMFSAGLSEWAIVGHPHAALAALLLEEVEGRIPEGELRARLAALKSAPEIPAQSLPAEAVWIVESGDDHLISPPMQAGLRASLSAGRHFRFTTGTHFPYVTRPEEYTALLEEVLGLAPAGRLWPAGAEAAL